MRMAKSGQIERGSEVFVFTDNRVMESTYFKGSSSSSKLHELIVELRKMEMEGQFIIHIIWVAGTRMIKQGADALSRGEFSNPAMVGPKFLDLLPLNETAFQRQGTLRSMVKGWLNDDWHFTTTTDWFHKVFTEPEGSWVWAPPPALAKIAVEQMCEVIHVFPKSRHVFICPSLLKGYWEKMLSKAADSVFEFKTMSSVWRKDMHEKLTIAFVAPLLSRAPWKVSRSPFMARWTDKLCEMQFKNSAVVRDHMRKFWVQRN